MDETNITSKKNSLDIIKIQCNSIVFKNIVLLNEKEHMDYNSKIASTDSIVRGTVDEFLKRAEQGKEKYGNTLDRTDLIDTDYLQHLKEELMDGILYLNKYIAIQKTRQ